MENKTLKEQLEFFENTLAEIEMYHMYEGKFDELVESLRNFERLVEDYIELEKNLKSEYSKSNIEEITEFKVLGKKIIEKHKRIDSSYRED